jgi:NAD(P)-dependent dehydrogenase (short-subunit alcohol dehydrogenase family)
VEALGGRGLIIPSDVSDPEQVEQAAEQVEQSFGPIDIWVNNAMVSVFAPFMKYTADEFRRVTEVTYLGYVWGTMAALKRMLPRNHGKIIQVGSALAYRGIPLQAAYCGAKHAIEGFTEAVRSELIHDKSRVSLSVVQLPGLNTPQFQWIRSKMPRKSQPVGTVFQPEVAARAIYWASQHKRREILVGFPTVQAVWGEKFIPGLLDHYLARTVYKGHMTDEPEDPNRLDNLWKPVAGDFGAHGPYDNRAKTYSLQSWTTMHRWLLGGLTALVAAGALASTLSLNKRN